MDINELRDATIKELQEHGWCSGWLKQQNGRHCVLGAVGQARWGQAWDIQMQNRLDGVSDCYEYQRDGVQRVTNNPYTALECDDVTGPFLKELIMQTSSWERLKKYDIHPSDLATVVYNWNDATEDAHDIVNALRQVGE